MYFARGPDTNAPGRYKHLIWSLVAMQTNAPLWFEARPLIDTSTSECFHTKIFANLAKIRTFTGKIHKEGVAPRALWTPRCMIERSDSKNSQISAHAPFLSCFWKQMKTKHSLRSFANVSMLHIMDSSISMPTRSIIASFGAGRSRSHPYSNSALN